jgi:hypothetical protein
LDLAAFGSTTFGGGFGGRHGIVCNEVSGRDRLSWSKTYLPETSTSIDHRHAIQINP